MGRRPLNTTKSGKYMNPTDQTRKMARKKELKKNKKQRLLIRTALLKSQNPKHLLNEMEVLDDMEYNVDKTPIYRDTVIQEKRRKLKIMFEKVMPLFAKENPTFYEEVKKLKREYEGRRQEKLRYYESIKMARNVNVDSIPLPQNENNDLLPYAEQNFYNFSTAYMAGTPFYNAIPLPGLSMMPTDFQNIANATNDYYSLKGILKSADRLTTIPGPPINHPQSLSPLRDSHHRKRDRHSTKLDDKRSSRRYYSRSKSNSRSRSRSRSRSSSGRPNIRRRSKSPRMRRRRSRSRSDDTTSLASERGHSYNDDDYEEIIAEDNTEDKGQSKKIRFADGKSDDEMEKDTRTKYKMLAKSVQRNQSSDQDAYSNFYSGMNYPYPPMAMPPMLMNHYIAPINEGLMAPPPPPSLGTSGDYYDGTNKDVLEDQPPHLPGQDYSLTHSSTADRNTYFGPARGESHSNVMSANNNYGGSSQIIAAPKIVENIQYHQQKQFSSGYSSNAKKDNNNNNDSGNVQDSSGQTVIEAKPQLRSLTEESLKFMPTSLLIKRNAGKGGLGKDKFGSRNFNQEKGGRKTPSMGLKHIAAANAANVTAAVLNLQNKEDAYASFMKEMEEFL